LNGKKRAERLLGRGFLLLELDRGYQFLLPLLLTRREQMRSYLAHAALKRADLLRLITPWKQDLEFAQDIPAGARWVSLHPGEDLFPLPHEGIFAGPPPSEHRDVLQRLLTPVLKG
jgi:hypothetical protein